MPKFKQPVSLQKLALNSLVTRAVHRCDELSISNNEAQLWLGITAIKKHLRAHLPGVLLAEFCKRFLNDFFSIAIESCPWRNARPDNHNRAALEIILDLDSVPLTCRGAILHYLKPSDAIRLRKVKILDWSGLVPWERVYRGLENYRLQDLTTFIFPLFCTDEDLEIIGRSCLKLQILRVHQSKDVTDRGLRALHPWSDLRFIDIHYCGVTDHGLNELLNIQRKLEVFNVVEYYTPHEQRFDVLSRPISLACPSVKRFALKSDFITNEHLHAIVALFPNLTSIQFCWHFTGDLCILKDLNNLTELEFGNLSQGFTIANLKQLLMNIGENISLLNLHSHIPVSQDDLNFISQVCKNIKSLSFCHLPGLPTEKFTIPIFPQLKRFKCSSHIWCDRFTVEFQGEMLKLEVLTIHNFPGSFEMIESMMLDHIKFPNLKEVRTPYHSDDEIPIRIMQTARNNNLDFSLKKMT